MPAVTDPVLAIDYPQWIIASMVELLDRFQARLPPVPDSCIWEGRAKTQYAIELGLLDENMAFLRYHLEATLALLREAGSCGRP